jgi:hypothetical protein
MTPKTCVGHRCPSPSHLLTTVLTTVIVPFLDQYPPYSTHRTTFEHLGSPGSSPRTRGGDPVPTPPPTCFQLNHPPLAFHFLTTTHHIGRPARRYNTQQVPAPVHSLTSTTRSQPPFQLTHPVQPSRYSTTTDRVRLLAPQSMH